MQNPCYFPDARDFPINECQRCQPYEILPAYYPAKLISIKNVYAEKIPTDLTDDLTHSPRLNLEYSHQGWNSH